MAAISGNPSATGDAGIAHRTARRAANARATAVARPSASADRLVELGCECTSVECDRTVTVPVDVYRRMLDADQYLLRPGHHAFARYRTIISVGLLRIEERS